MMLSEVNESVGGCEMLLGLTTWTQKWYSEMVREMVGQEADIE